MRPWFCYAIVGGRPYRGGDFRSAMEAQVIALMLYYKHAVLCLTHVKLRSASSPLQLWSQVGASLSLKPAGAGTVGANPLCNCSVGCFKFCMRFSGRPCWRGHPSPFSGGYLPGHFPFLLRDMPPHGGPFPHL